MTCRKLRVLLDLSIARRGYCGIAQDVRLLYKALASCPDVELTGLVYQPRLFGPLHRFLRADAPLGDRMANQARLLWSLAQEDVVWPRSRPLRILKKVQHLAAIACASRARLDRVEVDHFRDVLWRLLFSHTLSSNDASLVQNGKFLVSNLSDGMIHARSLLNRRPIKIDTRGYDFLIVQGPRPFRTSPETQLIVRYHDMIPVMHPDTMTNPLNIKGHHNGIRQCLDRALFVCNSEPTCDDLTRVYPALMHKSTTIPCMLSDVYRPDPNPHVVQSIIDVRRSRATGGQGRQSNENLQYIMCVSTIEPRKNFTGLIQAFNAVRTRPTVQRTMPDLKLLIVGSPGWKYEPILRTMREPVARGDLIHLEQVTADELRVLYSHAEAFVFPSHAEGFGFPPLEAMQCDTPVIASDLAEHRWVLGDAALYCNSYDTTSIADAIERLVASQEARSLRSSLIARGRERVNHYSLERGSARWLEFLHRVKAGQPPQAEATTSNATLELPDSMDRAA